MAFDFSKLNFFSKLNARMRIVVLLGGIGALIFLVYLGTVWMFGGGEQAIGPSSVASAPGGLQSVPGGKGLSAQYQQALQNASTQAAQTAQMSGGSALPTLINTSGDQMSMGSNQCVICYDKSANVKTLLDDWTRSGKISRALADDLQKLADKNVSPEEYAAHLEQLMKDGKLTPEQARELLEQYKKQHANDLLSSSSKAMDEMIKGGKLPLDVANELLTAQKNRMTPAEYAAMLQRLVKEGKLTPEAAQTLLNQYTQQYAKEVTQQSIAIIQRWAQGGEIIPEVEKNLIELENQRVPLDAVEQVLKKYVDQGKLTPAVAAKVRAEYIKQKAMMGPTGSMNEMIKKAEGEAYQELADLLRANQISQETATQIRGMIDNNITLDAFKEAIQQMVQQKQLTPEIAKLKIADYEKVKGLRDLSSNLANLHANNAVPGQYADALRNAVKAGQISPEDAAKLMGEYQAVSMPAGVSGGGGNIAETPAYAALQAQLQQTQGAGAPAMTASQFATAQTPLAPPETDQERETRLQGVVAAMSGQAQQLISAWQPTPMAHYQSSAALDKKDAEKAAAGQVAGKEGAAGGFSSTGSTANNPTLIKAGAILFAVLDTSIVSDYPDSPVLATIVDGKFKGAKLLGKLQTTKGVSGQLDRLMLNFSMMNRDEWEKSKAITAFAIDPDTARSVLASSVDYHYSSRFGAMIATSFLQGYGDAIKTSGSSTASTPSGTFSSNPLLSPKDKITAALGQVGQTLGTATQNYVNQPPTVKIDAGVSLGILFMADVTE